MFGRRTEGQAVPRKPASAPASPSRQDAPPPPASAAMPKAGPQKPAPAKPVPAKPAAPARASDHRSENYYQIKTTIFNALIDTIDLTQLAQLDAESAREEIRDIVNEILSIKNVVMSISEQEALLQDICNDVLGYGPLEPLLPHAGQLQRDKILVVHLRQIRQGYDSHFAGQQTLQVF